MLCLRGLLIMFIITGIHSDLVPLGSVAYYALFAGSTIANTGLNTKVAGNIGLTPGSAITGLPPLAAAVHINDGDAIAAKLDLGKAIEFATKIKAGT
jgi:hypothetical protein